MVGALGRKYLFSSVFHYVLDIQLALVCSQLDLILSNISLISSLFIHLFFHHRYTVSNVFFSNFIVLFQLCFQIKASLFGIGTSRLHGGGGSADIEGIDDLIIDILTLERNPPERKFLYMLKIFSQEDFALRSKLWPNNFSEHRLS